MLVGGREEVRARKVDRRSVVGARDGAKGTFADCALDDCVTCVGVGVDSAGGTSRSAVAVSGRVDASCRAEDPSDPVGGCAAASVARGVSVAGAGAAALGSAGTGADGGAIDSRSPRGKARKPTAPTIGTSSTTLRIHRRRLAGASGGGSATVAPTLAPDPCWSSSSEGMSGLRNASSTAPLGCTSSSPGAVGAGRRVGDTGGSTVGWGREGCAAGRPAARTAGSLSLRRDIDAPQR